LKIGPTTSYEVVVTRLASWLTAIMAASLACGVAPPLAARSAKNQVRVVTTPDGKTVYVVPAKPGKRPQVRSAVLPDGHLAYVVVEQPRDARTARQRCFDDELARLDGPPSTLALGSIDLRCSQR
jgi:hypothetical protein